MCKDGVIELARRLAAGQDQWGLLGEGPLEWEPVRDGLGERRGAGGRSPATSRRLAKCDMCDGNILAVRRKLYQVSYNLPDAAAYQAPRGGTPCLALGAVVPGQPYLKKRHSSSAWARWQGLMWHCYDVAFVEVDLCGAVGEFRPAEEADMLRPPDAAADRPWGGHLDEIRDALKLALQRARGSGCIPRGTSSRATTLALKPFCCSVLQEFGYGQEAPRAVADGPYFHPTPDLVYRGSAGTIAIEIKVEEDWDHPLGQALGYLLEHQAVLHIRVPAGDRHGIPDALPMITEAEKRLECTGRARFMCIWPPGL